MAAKVQLTGGNFQDALGNPLAGGYLEMVLSQDAATTDQKEVAAGYTVRIELDNTGNVVTSPAQSVWPNDVLLPSGTFYNVSGFNANGALVWGPNAQQVLGTSPFNVGTWVPGSVNLTSGSSLVIQTNGINNGSQDKLNLVASTGIALTDDGVGNVSIAASGGSGDVLLNPTTTQTITQPTGAFFVVEGTTDTGQPGIVQVGNASIVAQTGQPAGQGSSQTSSVSVYSSDSTNSNLKYSQIQARTQVVDMDCDAYGHQPASITATTAMNILTGTGTSPVLIINAAAGNIVVTLPATPVTADGILDGIAMRYIFKRIDSTGNTVTIQTNTGQHIDAATSYPLTGQWSYVDLMFIPTSLLGSATWTVVGHS